MLLLIRNDNCTNKKILQTPFGTAHFVWHCTLKSPNRYTEVLQ